MFQHPSICEWWCDGACLHERTALLQPLPMNRFLGLAIFFTVGIALVLWWAATLVGHKLGEFAVTRTFKGHSGDRKTK